MKRKVTLFLAIAFMITSTLSSFATVTYAAPKKLKLNVKRLNLTVGSNYQLRIYNLKKRQKVSFSSSNPSVAFIEQNTASKKKITVKALTVCSTTIIATVKKKKKVAKILKCRIRVSPSAVGIKFMKRQSKIAVNRRLRLETIVKPNTSLEQPVFESGDTDIATVNSRGVVTAIAPGTVTITATLLSCGVSANCTIIVLPEKENDTSNQKTKRHFN